MLLVFCSVLFYSDTGLPMRRFFMYACFRIFLLTLCNSYFLGGCATIFSGKKQSILEEIYNNGLFVS